MQLQKNNASDFLLGPHPIQGTHTQAMVACGRLFVWLLFVWPSTGWAWPMICGFVDSHTQEAYNIVADFSYCLQQFSCGQICLQCSFLICGFTGIWFGLRKK